MAEIVNLNKARKAIRKREEAAEAAANRVKFGRTLAETRNDRREEARRATLLEGAKRGEPEK